MKKARWLVVIVVAALPLSVWAQETAAPKKGVSVSLGVLPGAVIPIGVDADLFTTGPSGALQLEVSLRSLPFLRLAGGIGYTLSPVVFETSASILSASAGPAVSVDFLPWLGVHATGQVGYYYAFLNSGGEAPSGGGLAFSGWAGLHFNIGSALTLGLEGGYTSHLGLESGIGVRAGVTYHFGAATRGSRTGGAERPTLYRTGEIVELGQIDFDPVFPVFFKYYDTNPVGSAVLRNKTDAEITDISVTLNATQFMDNPKVCTAPASLGPGEEQPVALAALFSEKVLEIVEATKTSTEIVVEFTYLGERVRDSYIQTMDLHDRNATTWDDDRRAAAFVTNKDPSVLALAKMVAGLASGTGSSAVSTRLRTAMALHEALALYGMSYVQDPSTPYAEFSENESAVDYLQFPRQTLEFRSGDCDDLSILYSSCLEAVAIPTELITIPGHIFIAFDLGMSPEEARRTYQRAEDFIFRDDKTWVPVEITEIGGGFLKAWQTGAREWREAAAREQANAYPVSECWGTYAAVGLPGRGKDLELPTPDRIREGLESELTAFVDREIYAKVASIQGEITKEGATARNLSRLAVLYARWGLYDRAERELTQALQKEKTYTPAIINMGNLYFLQKQFDLASVQYDEACRLEPNNAAALLGLARAAQELENYGTVQRAFSRVKELSPDLARQYAFLDLRGEEATRAASTVEATGRVEWAEP